MGSVTRGSKENGLPLIRQPSDMGMYMPTRTENGMTSSSEKL